MKVDEDRDTPADQCGPVCILVRLKQDDGDEEEQRDQQPFLPPASARAA